ncbi:MAG TPA: M28 family metallopeptidase [Allosphingosinicella sp.]|jgi:Zn-dependent M28 family amino/carboxypeptidase
MRLLFPLLLALSGCATANLAPLSRAERASAWWADVVTLSSDAMEGRQAGTPGYDRAAAFVVERLRSLGLEPAGSEGFYQRVELEEQFLDPATAHVALVSNGAETMLRVPEDMVVSRRAPLPQRIDAPLVFVGYGLHMPEAGHDDFAGVDLRGKIAVYVGGGPAEISAALKSHARAERARLLAERGAVGGIGISTPSQMETPWARTAAAATQSGMYFADPEIRSVPGIFFEAGFNPAEAERLFAGSGRLFSEIAALSDASRAIAGFDLRRSLRATLAPRTRRLASSNIVARLPGRDPGLRPEHVVLSAHLDGLGIGEPVNGDRIYNGALDNASGVAALLDIAAQIRRTRVQPRRSLLFVIVTGEEKGLLGARYYARRPTVPRESIVADLNYDMALPLFPLTGINVIGAEESSIGADARAAADALGIALVPDAFPNRNAFIRSDQYAFIEQGVPAAAFRFGFAAGTPEAEIDRVWRLNHYHAPSDDGSQPVFREDEIRLHDFIAAVALRIANADSRPRWNETSFFRRFAASPSP